MNRKTIISVVLAMSLATGGVAFAQGRGDRNDHERNDERGRNEQTQRGGQQDHRDNDWRQPDRRGDNGRADNDRSQDRWQNQRGAGPDHQFHRGQRLPQEYRHRQYVVDDWRGHRLSAPPRGYHWVQTGGDYVLVAIGSGIILQLFLGN